MLKITTILLFLAACAPGATLIRIACGGQGGTDAAGNVWAADAYFTGGARWDASNQPALTSQPIPYRTLRYSASVGAPFSYNLPLPAAGSYKVTLFWLEPNKTGVGQRILSAVSNGTALVTNLDLFAVAPGALKPYSATFPVTITGTVLQINLTATLGNAVLSAIQVDDVPVIPPPPPGRTIHCAAGTVNGSDLTADAPSQEVTVLSAIPGNRRWEQINICETTRFMGQPAMDLTVSMGRPGTNDYEMTGTVVPLVISSNNTGCWTAHPSPPQFGGPYDVVLNFAASLVDTASGARTPGNVSHFPTGVLSWEACWYDGIIGDPNVIGAAAVNLYPTTAVPGKTSSLDLSLASPAGGQPAAIQWSVSYPSTESVTAVAGPALTAAGKSLSCAGGSGMYTCVAWGLNATAIPDGVVATLSVTPSSSSPVHVQVGNALGSSPAGDVISITSTAALTTSMLVPTFH